MNKLVKFRNDTVSAIIQKFDDAVINYGPLSRKFDSKGTRARAARKVYALEYLKGWIRSVDLCRTQVEVTQGCIARVVCRLRFC